MKKEDLIKVLNFRLDGIIESAELMKKKLAKKSPCGYEVNSLRKDLEMIEYDYNELNRKLGRRY